MDAHKKVAFYTLGCKLNFSETSTIARNFQNEGFERVGFEEAADLGKIREVMDSNGYGDAVVQLYGSSRDVVIRLAEREGVKVEMLGNEVMSALQEGTGQAMQMRRIEFVGGSVGDDLAEQGVRQQNIVVRLITICLLRIAMHEYFTVKNTRAFSSQNTTVDFVAFAMRNQVIY